MATSFPAGASLSFRSAVASRSESRLNRHSLGLALLVAGQPLAWTARDLLGFTNSFLFSAGMIAVALLMLTDLGVLFQAKLYATKLSIAPPLLWLTGTVVLAVGAAKFTDRVREPLYQLAIVAALVAIHSVRPSKLASFCKALFLVSFITTTIPLLQFLTGRLTLNGRLAAGDSNSPNQLAFVAGFLLISSLIWAWCSPHTLRNVLATTVAILTAIATAVLSNTRSVFIGVAICLLYKFAQLFINGLKRRSNVNISSRLSTYGAIAILSVTVVITYTRSRSLNAYLDDVTTHLKLGYLGYVEGVSGVESSAETRRRLMFYELANLNWTGHGYRSLYIDCPALQSFGDGGIILGVLFLVITICIPVTIVAKKLLSDHSPAPPLEQLMTYFYLISVPNLFLHGEPYDFTTWFYLVAVYGTLVRTLPRRISPSKAS